MSDFEGKAGFASTPGGCSKREVCAVVCVPYVSRCQPPSPPRPPSSPTHRSTRAVFTADRSASSRSTYPSPRPPLSACSPPHPLPLLSIFSSPPPLSLHDSQLASAAYAASRRLLHLDSQPQASSPLFEFAIFVLSTTLACLCGSCCLAMMYLLMAIPLALYAMSYPAGKLIALRSEASHEAGEIPALTQLRAIIMLQTIFCILAVDFPVFPRRFSKTREFGTSLMDLGVGAVVLSGALSRGCSRNSRLAGGSLSRRACHVVKRQLPLLTLGLCRILLVKASDYHNAAHEYGVHWNFFFTLALVSMMAACFTPASPAASSTLAVMIMIAHQVALSFGLSRWALTAPRLTLLSANKEGLVSLPGFVGLSLMGTAIGSVLQTHDSRRGLLQLIALDVMLWGAAYVVERVVESPSRRLCNAAFVLWTSAQVVMALAISYATYSIIPSQPQPLLKSFNHHLLASFVLANIFTGLVNIFLPTTYASYMIGVIILVSYQACVCTIVRVMSSSPPRKWLE